MKQYLADQTEENLVEFKRVTNRIKRKLRKIKTDSFKSYCENLNFSKGIQNVWKSVKGLISKNQATSNSTYTDTNNPALLELQNGLVKEYIPLRTHILLPVTEPEHPMNVEFSMTEFQSALEISNSKSAPGMDSITFDIIKRLPANVKKFYLQLFNKMFYLGNFPESWRDTLVRFIPKGGGGFRPISLTSCFSKLFERLVNRRLEHLSESRDWLPCFQFGFRRGRSAVDAVSCLVSDIYRSFGEKKNMVALALDIKGAFSCIYPDKIIQEMIDLDVPGRLINFVSFLITKKNLHFSLDRSKVRYSGVGLPQGGVLSPFLFSLALRKIERCLGRDTKILMFADDIFIYVVDENVDSAKAMIVQSFNSVSGWLLEFGLEISIPKTQFIIFKKSTKVAASEQSIILNHQSLKASKKVKYLGIILDHKLLWNHHINYLISRISRANNVIKVLAKVSSGPSPEVLRVVCKGLMEAIGNWGVSLFWKAAQTHLKGLDKAIFSSIRVATGLLMSTPIAILLSEFGFIHPGLVRAERAQQTVLRNAQWQLHPTLMSLKSLSRDLDGFSLKLPRESLGVLCSYWAAEGLMDMMWPTERASYFDLEWSRIQFGEQADSITGLLWKDDQNTEIPFREYLNEECGNNLLIYTDASLNPSTLRSAIAFYIPEMNIQYGVRVSSFHTVKSLELLAMFAAAQFSRTFELKNILLISDSRNAVSEMGKPLLGNYEVSRIVQELKLTFELYRNQGLGEVKILWIPSHSGITGNDRADYLARTATEFPTVARNKVDYADLKLSIKKDIEFWGVLCWSYGSIADSTNIYYEFVNVKTARPWFKNLKICRRMVCLINRIRSGHFLTAEYFQRFNWNVTFDCLCGFEYMDIRHLLCDCPLYRRGRDRFLRFLSVTNTTTNDPVFNLRETALSMRNGTVTEVQKFFLQTKLNW
ncbi:uncharacterized protein LOC127285311 [Leptopilina boulardi]|uniref:uncharacterized protein LOC127285311 n=1 Tax=Leptopilina boulardi TaxID=63433 RepID=UPI0021F594C9|nr:uncharacterized protein LOC127285311 [Leptopilina boulardi]